MSEPSEWARERAREAAHRIFRGALLMPDYRRIVADRLALEFDAARAEGKAEGVAEEREACLKIVEDMTEIWAGSDYMQYVDTTEMVRRAAAEIRARGRGDA